MKHKHAELIIAWANGAEIEWQSPLGNWISICNPKWDEYTCYRIKPPEVAQWRKDMAQALKDGKEVQYLNYNDDWVKCVWSPENFLSADYSFDEKYRFRIKLKPKPDEFTYLHQCHIKRGHWTETERINFISELKLIWDGETGNLKSAEVLK